MRNLPTDENDLREYYEAKYEKNFYIKAISLIGEIGGYFSDWKGSLTTDKKRAKLFDRYEVNEAIEMNEKNFYILKIER